MFQTLKNTFRSVAVCSLAVVCSFAQTLAQTPTPAQAISTMLDPTAVEMANAYMATPYEVQDRTRRNELLEYNAQSDYHDRDYVLNGMAATAEAVNFFDQSGQDLGMSAAESTGSLAGSLSSAYADESKNATLDKTLNVGCEGAFAPFTYIDDQGNITGFDIDLIKAIGKDLGYNVKINVMPFDGLIPSLMTGNIDLIISGFTISEERAKKVDFSDPYYLCGMSYVIEKKNAQKYDTYEKLDGHPICTQLAATGTNFTQKFLQKSKDKIFNTPPETYIELGNGSCLAAIHDKPVNDFFLTKDNSGKFTSIEIKKHIDKEYYGIAVQKGNKELLNQINKGLKEVEENGVFEKISMDWFGNNILDSLKETE